MLCLENTVGLRKDKKKKKSFQRFLNLDRINQSPQLAATNNSTLDIYNRPRLLISSFMEEKKESILWTYTHLPPVLIISI